jgi:hypothetical protein
MEILNAALVSSHTHTLLPHLTNEFTTSTHYARPRPDRFRGPPGVHRRRCERTQASWKIRSNILQAMADVGDKIEAKR